MLEQSFCLLNVHSAFSWHKNTITFQLSPVSHSLLYSLSVKGEKSKFVKKTKREGGKGLETEILCLPFLG